jgi:sucrose phosphorylase
LWATFSEDQIDVNFANPDVLLEFLEILLFYLGNGARMIRLDAIAFLWKQLGSSCIHLPQTHQVVKLIRDIFNHLYPDCILLTETNVPHDENLSYFGDGDEARPARPGRHIVQPRGGRPDRQHAPLRRFRQHEGQPTGRGHTL